MNLKRASEVIYTICNDKGKVSDDELWKALKLSHGALKMIVKFRAMGSRLAKMRLPGETKD